MNNKQLPVPAFFKTSTMFLDDDPYYLESLELPMEEGPILYKASTKPSEVIELLQNPKHKLPSWLSRKTDEEDTDERVISLQIDQIQGAMLRSESADVFSSLVVDYEMPTMNGLEVCERITNPNIQKILLTGAVDDSFGVDAINRGIIHKFFRKHDPYLIPKLREALGIAQEAFFRRLFDPVLRTFSEDKKSALNLPEFKSLFEEKLKETKAKEYFLLDSTGSYGFLKPNGQQSNLIIKAESQMMDDFKMVELEEATGDKNLLADLKSFQKFLYCPNPAGFLECNGEKFCNHILPAKKLSASSPYYYYINDGVDDRSKISQTV